MPDQTMPWEQLSIDTTQVLFCDLQKQIVARSKTTRPEALSQSAGVLLQLAKLFQLPVTLSVVPEEQKAPEVIPALVDSGAMTQKPRTPDSPFCDSATVERLGEGGRKVLIIAGFATEVVVLHAALDARKHGYQVLVPVDACGGMSTRTEEAAFRQMERSGAITTAVVSIATKFAPDFTTELGKQMFSIVQQLRLG